MSVNWDEPIEAVHEDGRVIPLSVTSVDSMNDGWTGPVPGYDMEKCCWSNDGEEVKAGWRIRNVAQAPETGSTAPSPSEVGPEMQRAAVMQLAEAAAAMNVALDGRGWETERRAILEGLKAVRDAGVLLPEPVDADLVEARRVACESSRWTPGDEAWRNVEQGRSDHIPMVRAALAGLKAGRALEKEAGR